MWHIVAHFAWPILDCKQNFGTAARPEPVPPNFKIASDRPVYLLKRIETLKDGKENRLITMNPTDFRPKIQDATSGRFFAKEKRFRINFWPFWPPNLSDFHRYYLIAFCSFRTPRRGLNPPHRVKSISMTSLTPEEMDILRSRGNHVSLLLLW